MIDLSNTFHKNGALSFSVNLLKDLQTEQLVRDIWKVTRKPNHNRKH